jgi:hypothetical protein
MQQNPMNPLDQRIDGLYRVVKGRIDWDNMVPICIEVAQEIEQMGELKGQEKLDLLLKTLKFALAESDLPREKKESVTYIISTVIPLVVQAAIVASKHPIVKQIQAGCWTLCCSKK